MGSGIDVLLGDFNIYPFEEVAYRRLKDTLSRYNLKALEPTHLDDALLHHVYLHKTFGHDKLLMSVVNKVYCSDHDAVKCNWDSDKIVTIIMILTVVFKYRYIVIKALWILRYLLMAALCIF